MHFAIKASVTHRLIPPNQNVKSAFSHSIGLTENQRQWPYDVDPHHAQKAVNQSHAIVSKPAPSSLVRRSTGTRLCSSAATPILSLGAPEAPHRKLLR